MGFMDKAKKMAEQAQAKLDEAQTAFNERQGQGVAGTPGPQGAASPVDYDQHGRPVAGQPHSDARGESATPPHGDPLVPEAPTAGLPATPHEDAPAETTTPPHGDPLSAEAPKPKAPPPSGGTGMTSGDPLGG
jgi:hypothetical protein